MDDASRARFQILKAICVPLMESSSLTPSSIPKVSRLLADLIDKLRQFKASGIDFPPSQISYIFFPISTILSNNQSSAIPDQILERVLVVLAILCEDWWWHFQAREWEQIFMLCGGVIGGIEVKGKEKQRDDETKEAAVRCLHVLSKKRSSEPRAEERHQAFLKHAHTDTFVPIIGQTLNSVLVLTDSSRLSLQLAALDVIHTLVDDYIPDYLIPSVLPGVVSTMSKLSLGAVGGKGWVNGSIVAKALQVLQVTVVRAIGDEACEKDGAICPVNDLEDLASLLDETQPTSTSNSNVNKRFATTRTASWVHGTASQLHIALNSLTALVKHPTPLALASMIDMASTIISATPTTLPQSQMLLLSFLLSLSINDYPKISAAARTSILGLVASKAQRSILQTLVHLIRDNLAALPRLLASQADAKVEHVAGLIDAVCQLGVQADSTGIPVVSREIGKLLGPNGSIEKWGWSLLSVLELANPQVTITKTSSAQPMLESTPSGVGWASFPELSFKNVALRSTYDALVSMLYSLGLVAGDVCLSSVEWFTSVGLGDTSPRAVAALWCACHLLEGSAKISLTTSDTRSTYLATPNHMRFSRELAKSVARLWDGSPSEVLPTQTPVAPDNSEDRTEISVVKGINPIYESLKIVRPSNPRSRSPPSQPMLHRALSLRLLAVTAGILQSRQTSLLLYTLYPVLHSIVSPFAFLSSTALATLNYMTATASYASPANLLMSNFDYVLDSVSRRLTRRWLDVEATKVFLIIIHLTGHDVVERAEDVVEECFDRLDDFHGYEAVVEGLVEVLAEVVKVIKTEKEFTSPSDTSPVLTRQQTDAAQFQSFIDEYKKARELVHVESEEEPYEPAPREAWGKSKEEDTQNAEESNPHEDPQPTPVQAITTQIVSRSMYFLTHGSPRIRARILSLLSSSAAVLPMSALMPNIHAAWPFILNRLADQEVFVVAAAASLVESLSTHMGTLMYHRIWDDIWPRFHKMLDHLNLADSANALARRGPGAVGTESAYTYSHRLYRSLLKTMTAAMGGVQPQDTSVWQLILSFRRFLNKNAHDELQQCARDLYVVIGRNNPDAVWLALHATISDLAPALAYLREPKWDISDNAHIVCQLIDT